MGTERILYPCYFNGAFSRAEGRRISKKHALKSPKIQDIERAARDLGISQVVIEPNSHPAHWSRREGRLRVNWQGSKELLIQKIALKLSEKQ
ncbi:MAG: signal recognition particle subunit SRP19/SEC65 family protein [Methanocalculus sp.]|uniref:signal recognition particle subunit SRP19/SEC65 family protein n=1 Tax=Methanocalculus sp. TaxID=2004547 RepID=UPI00271DD74D|nr:signal recognition particle subunit SRP19/SEC65 family protein [Methanocalculus sp.]MDO9539235.1 signal recognition particle subunit SRP19/SEC65 family protein [Methanocalculus sp.]